MRPAKCGKGLSPQAVLISGKATLDKRAIWSDIDKKKKDDHTVTVLLLVIENQLFIICETGVAET